MCVYVNVRAMETVMVGVSMSDKNAMSGCDKKRK